MVKEEQLGIQAKKEEDFSEWYNEVIIKAGLAEHSPIKGFMIIKPAGYALWEKIQSNFDSAIKKMGVQNAYFPLLIPESFFKKEAEHAQGFAPELAWVEEKEDGEKYAIRPTSETIMYDAYSRWIRSWRDLPFRLNQWCSVLRWEVKQTKLFLRTREFLWQEGHCVYETEEDCEKETRQYLGEYKKVAEELLAVPVIAGEKTSKERFAGAKRTYTIEAFMPDGKALQMGTSHNLGQNFAKAFGISYLGKDEKNHLPWQNSWGISTRLVGALVMMHADNKGLVIPPKIAPIHAVIVPIFRKGDDKDTILNKANEIKKELSHFVIHIDDRDEYTPGWKYNEWELKGIPLRIELGPKDIEKDQVVLVRRDTGTKEFVPVSDLPKKMKSTLEHMQNDLFEKAKHWMDSNIVQASNWQEFEKGIEQRKLVKVFFCDDPKAEEEIKEKSQASSRVMPFSETMTGKCFYTGKEGKVTYFAKAY